VLLDQCDYAIGGQRDVSEHFRIVRLIGRRCARAVTHDVPHPQSALFGGTFRNSFFIWSAMKWRKLYCEKPITARRALLSVAGEEISAKARAAEE